MRLKNFVLVGSMAVLGVAFTSCSKGEELFDSGAKIEQQKSEYATNFEKKYGPIDPNQTWDFATMDPIYTLPSTGSAGTRAGAGDISVNITSYTEDTERMEFGQGVIEWMHNNMKAGKNNTAMGSPFYMVTQEESFTVVPFYQGIATYFWELWVNIGGIERQIWSKYDNLQYKTTGGEWKTPTASKGIPEDAVAIKAPKFEISATKDLQMYFFLKVWDSDSAYKSDKEGLNARKLTSLDLKMLALQGIERPSCVPEGNELTIIGCEDATDRDYEDLVFLMYGKPVPPVHHVEVVEKRQTKRYMMEDLGTTDDFDFNDVVVDVSDVYQKKITYDYDANHRLVFQQETETLHYQDAIVRAAGGTMNFTIKIGNNTSWTKSDVLSVTEMKNTGWGNTPIYYDGSESELAKFIIKNNEWNPKTNNITVIVEGNGQADEIIIKFPEAGEAPMMIAVNGTTRWMTERSGVPRSWFEK